MSALKYQDRVIWWYSHANNKKSRTTIIRYGMYVAPVRHRPGGKYGSLEYSTTRSMIATDGNRNLSKVPNRNIMLDTPENRKTFNIKQEITQ